MSKLRIQKFLSEAGAASRREAETMILDGRITVNGKLVSDVPCFVDAAADDIRVDGRRVQRPDARRAYYLLNKPRGVVCTQRDPQGRPRAVDLVPRTSQRVYCAGRLDADSTGLLVLTNDGQLTQLLTHPSHGVAKTYVVEIDGRLEGDELDRLKAGMWLGPKRARGAHVKVLRRGAERSLLEIRLTEGRNREIRRMLARLGHKVRRLKRTAIGPITDRGLKIGNWRPMKGREVAMLKRSGTEHRNSKQETKDDG